MASAKSRLVSVCLGICVVIIVGLVITVIVLATKESGNGDADHGQTQPEVQTGVELMELFNVNDAINITWYPSAADISDVNKALKDKVRVLEVEVVLTSGNFYLQDGKTNIDEVLDMIKNSTTGLKLNLQQTRNMTKDIRSLINKVKSAKIKSPVIISIPVFSSLFDWNKFLLDKRSSMDNTVVNFDLTSLCCLTPIGQGVIERVDYLNSQLKLLSTVEIDIGSIPSSWGNIRWLVGKNDRLSLILSSRTPQASDVIYKSLIVRNDINKNKVLYNFKRTLYNEFTFAASSAGSPLLYFDIYPRDAGKIRWSHNTDTWEQINAATKGDIMMIEGDIQVLGQGTANQTDVPIMGHDIGDYNNITFEQWLDEIIKVDKGMKFDFKSIDGVRPALKITKQKLDKIKGPIWLNADILQGPDGVVPRIPKNEFLEAVQEFEATTLSLGWTTVAKKENYHLKYTMDMVTEMHEITKHIKQPITFPVRAEQLKDSLAEFHWLLSQSRDYTVTVWTGKGDNVTKSDMDFVKRQTEAARIYFDLPEEIRPTI